MTHVYDDPDTFKDAVLVGFAAAHPGHVQRVGGASGFVRAGGPTEGMVSLVVGGGSGHYPSYNGVVGTGFAAGAVLGDVFASPSAEQVYRVARAAHGGAGVVLGFGNYAGDRLNFAVAAERLLAEGIDVRMVWVTDDLASAPPEEAEKRRGIAGTFTVYKLAGAAAETGAPLDEVERVMRKANTATHSYGVAFGGCTLPGAAHPLFEVAPGVMDFGLGIHGEPGIRSAPWMPAPALAAELVRTVLAERPADADGRAAVLLNGLGATKYEELYALWGEIGPLLTESGVTAVQPEVGELVTSLDMAGCSLSLTWLDDELEPLWRAPAETAAYRRGTPAPHVRQGQSASESVEIVVQDDVEPASETSIRSAGVARDLVRTLSETIEEHRDELGRLDAVAGDGDHGIGMSRGARAALAAAAAADGGVKTILTAAGSAFGDQAGGTSGILWGLLLTTVGESLGNQDEVTASRVAVAVRSATERLQAIGKAERGDKTMLDALLPFVEELETHVDSRASLVDAWRAAAAVGVKAANETAPLVPRLGRARPLAERSVGTPDPGAVSLALIVTAIGERLHATTVHHEQREMS